MLYFPADLSRGSAYWLGQYAGVGGCGYCSLLGVTLYGLEYEHYAALLEGRYLFDPAYPSTLIDVRTGINWGLDGREYHVVGSMAEGNLSLLSSWGAPLYAKIRDVPVSEVVMAQLGPGVIRLLDAVPDTVADHCAFARRWFRGKGLVQIYDKTVSYMVGDDLTSYTYTALDDPHLLAVVTDVFGISLNTWLSKIPRWKENRSVLPAGTVEKC